MTESSQSVPGAFLQNDQSNSAWKSSDQEMPKGSGRAFVLYWSHKDEDVTHLFALDLVHLFYLVRSAIPPNLGFPLAWRMGLDQRSRSYNTLLQL